MPSRRSSPPSRSIRFRVTALFVLIFGATLLTFCGLLYTGFARNHQVSFDTALYNHAQELVNELREAFDINTLDDPEALAPGANKIRGNEALLNITRAFPFSSGKALIQLLSLEREVIVKSSSLAGLRLPILEDDWQRALSNGFALSTVRAHEIFHYRIPRETQYRLLTLAVKSARKPAFVFQIAVSTTHLDQANRSLAVFFLIGIPLTLLVATLGGLYLAGRALAPVSAIIAQVETLSPGNLTTRVPVPTAQDELRQLSLILNSLLDRLQKAFESQDRFIADASHEIKTPLAIVHAELDQLLHSKETPETVLAPLTSASQEVHHLIQLVEDLLTLARIDAGSACLVIQSFRVDEALLEVISRLDRVAKAKGAKIRLNLTTAAESGPGSDFSLSGDPVLFQVLIKNLVENAIKFSPPNGIVDVEAQQRSEGMMITIRDRGRGIPVEVLPHIFERFYRAKNATGTPGTGLGLAITRRIAELHGFEVTVESTVGMGTTFRLSIKKA